MSGKQAKRLRAVQVDSTDPDYRQIENVYALTQVVADGKEALVVVGGKPVVGDSMTALATVADWLTEKAGVSMRAVRFVRAEVVEVFEP